MYNILRTLTYGQRLQISEGKIRIPLDDPYTDTWVTKSEEANHKKGKRVFPVRKDSEPIKKEETPIKGDDQMAGATGNCEPGQQGYFCWSPKPKPTTYAACEFTSCCCEDGNGALMELLYQFILTKKAANPSILWAGKRWSPNGACGVVDFEFSLLSNAPQTMADTDSILAYYLSLLGY
jgi:hypothetical protein